MEITGKHILIAFVVIVAGMFAFNMIGSGSATSNGTVQEANGQQFSGTLVGMDPNRAMADSPCHVMGGQIMGDCQVREINFEAWRYDWSEPTITVKSGELVRLKATSRDVTHGIAIPQIGFNLHIKPGETTEGEFIAPAPGEYPYQCSVMCGSGHMQHRGRLIVV